MEDVLFTEVRSFLKGYAATPTSRDFIMAVHIYNFAIEDVRKEAEKAVARNAQYCKEGKITPESMAARDGQMFALIKFLNGLKR